MRIRICINCRTEYEHYGQRASRCRECRREYDRLYHNARTAESKRRKQRLQKERKERIARWIKEYKVRKTCFDCGNADFRVLDFDHLPEFVKDFNIGQGMVDGKSLKSLQQEILKCQVVCSNCHRIRTYERNSRSVAP